LPEKMCENMVTLRSLSKCHSGRIHYSVKRSEHIFSLYWN